MSAERRWREAERRASVSRERVPSPPPPSPHTSASTSSAAQREEETATSRKLQSDLDELSRILALRDKERRAVQTIFEKKIAVLVDSVAHSLSDEQRGDSRAALRDLSSLRRLASLHSLVQHNQGASLFDFKRDSCEKGRSKRSPNGIFVTKPFEESDFRPTYLEYHRSHLEAIEAHRSDLSLSQVRASVDALKQADAEHTRPPPPRA